MIASTYVLTEKILGALPGQCRAGCIVTGARIAIEAVVCMVQINLRLSMRSTHLLDARQRNILVALAIVQQDRAPGHPIELLPDAAGVVADRRMHRQRRSANPGELPAPAVADECNAAGVL